MAALFAGRLAGGVICSRSAGRPGSSPHAGPPRTVDLVLDGLACIVTDGPAAAAPALRRAVRAFVGADITAEDAFRWGWLAQAAASILWDDDAWRTLLVRQVGLARAGGALDELPVMLGALGTAVAWSGDFESASALIIEAETICEVTGARAAPFTAIMLASLQGRQAAAESLIEVTLTEAQSAGQGIAVAYAHWAAATLNNGLGRYEEALTAARQASDDTSALHLSMWALPEMVEAAARTGDTHLATDAAERLTGYTEAGGTDFGLGIQARCQALVSGPQDAESLFREAIERLGRTKLRPDFARAYLLYGEWLRRANRRTDARARRSAHAMLDAIGMEAFAERARRELLATGETVRKRTAEALTTLTAQEACIARLARDGLPNSEIGAQLFLSVRTVEWHLRKVFSKLGIGSTSRPAHGAAHRSRTTRLSTQRRAA